MSDTSHLRKPSTETAKMADALETFVTKGDRMRPQEREHLKHMAIKGIQYLRDIAAFAKGRGQ